MNNNYFYIYLLSFVSLVSLLFGRLISSGYIYSSTESYFVLQNDVFTYYNYLISFFSGFEVVIPLLSGMVSIYLLYLIFNQLNFSNNVSYISLFLIILSPIWLYSYTNLLSFGFSFVLILGAVLLYLKSNNYYLILLGLSVFFSPILFLVSIVLFSVYSKINNKKMYSLLLLPLLFVHGIELLFVFTFETGAFFDLFIEFGFLKSVSLITLSLGILGIIFFWKRTTNYIFIANSSFILLLASIIYSDLVILVNIIYSVISSYLILYIYNKKWHVNVLKFYTLLLIFCAYLFITISFVSTSINFNNDKFEALEILRDLDEGVVLSSENNGFLINYVSEKDVFIDERSYRYRDYDLKKEYMDTVFYSVRLAEVRELFEKHNIKYLFVDKDMISGNIWSSRQEGLLFVAENSDAFKTIYDGDVIIYEFVS
ncbi:MAG: hypothetical protein ACMXX9_01760 [Candidatus Woesearchaeota archaeon]